MTSPTVSFDGNTYMVSLFRPDATGAMKENTYTFSEHTLSVCAAFETDLESWERTNIKGPVSDDGKIYYLSAQPQDVGRPCLTWLQNRDESIAHRKAIEDAEQLYYHMNDDDRHYEDDVCTFCGQMISECGEDHGDEMRDIQREYWRSQRY